MKTLTEYLERAVEFERLAASEKDETFKAELLKQAAAYRKLAAKRAEEYGLPMPSSPETKQPQIGLFGPFVALFSLKSEREVL